MKIEIDKEILLHEKYIKSRTNHCKEDNRFLDLLEKEMKSLDVEESNTNTTSIFAEKRTNKNKTDIFDTLINI
ncbi:hypothetical protein [Arcobacter sp. LA11]|uniref:hypothetical protein n=1 Tax=Arcobacter sp. LA11 TaxID=1898176 RepID=UPI0009352CDE|nr:hypothetical protein [Arcobacter sp. LA11]